MTTTWSTTDKSSGAGLSGGNLIVTFTSNGHYVRSADRIYNSKNYCELTFTTTTNASIGLTGGWTTAAQLNSVATGVPNILVTNAGNIWDAGAVKTALGGTVTNGWVCCLAVDTVARLVWFRNGAGNWNGSAGADPATGVGGHDIGSWLGGSGSGNPFGVYVFASGGSGGGVVTANFGASAFSQSVPSGFTSGFPDSTTMITAAVATQADLEEWANNADARVTQLALEQWVNPASGNVQALMTQIALEEWVSVAVVSDNVDTRAIIMA